MRVEHGHERALQPYIGTSSFALKFFDILDLARRAATAGQIGDPVSPESFLAWADTNRIPCSEALRDALIC
jgi:hypothetical protein